MANFLNQVSMDPAAESVHSDNPGKPSMEAAPRSSAIRRKAKTMAADAKPDESGKGSMGKFGAAKRADTPKSLGEQEPAKKPATRPVESYLRLRVRVENGKMAVVDAREVEGPLVAPSEILSGYAAELIHEGKPVAVEAIADMGERRPYFDPARAEAERASHGSFGIPSAEFALRVSRGAVPLKSLPKAEIALYQVKDPSQPLQTRRDTMLAAHYEREVREVARLKGIRIATLPAAAQASVKRVLK